MALAPHAISVTSVAPSADNRHVIGEVSFDDWSAAFRQMVDVNLLGAANLAWAVATHLIGRGAHGAIVNVGSRGAFRGEPEYPAYAATKAGLHALGQSLARALVEDVTARARRQGMTQSALVSVQDSARFWEALGWREASTQCAGLQTYPDGALYMVRTPT